MTEHPTPPPAGTPSVPDWLIGVWRRDLLEWDDGEDRSTRVIWLQSPTLFADLRIPADGGAEAEGFAGHLSVTGQVCRWHRPIDVKPKGGDGDVGVVYRRGTRMIECGVHRNYLEEWRLVADGAQHLAASRGAVRAGAEDPQWPADGTLEIVVSVGGHIIHAWRGADGAGLGYGSIAGDGPLVFDRRAGSQSRTAPPGPWQIWSTTFDPPQAERLLARL